MLLLYFDEVKFDPPTQRSFWLGGICLDADLVPEIEAQVNEISKEVFGSSLLTKETEFHGKEIVGGRGNFKGRAFPERLEILQKLLSIVGREDVLRIYVRILPENITHSTKPPDEIAFMYLVEQADLLFKELGSVGMLLGDYDEPTIGSSVASLSRFRVGGTSWDRSREIDNIIDTVHFARSHHSRLIQLADIFLFCQQFLAQDNSKWWRKSVEDAIKESGIQSCSRVRVWPSEARWYR